jgi:hypothetical protein
MSYIIKNMSTNRPIVCTLGDGKTLRLFPGREKQISDRQYTGYLKNLSEQELLTVREVVERKTPKKPTVEKTVDNKESKEE